jgi:thioredoxin-dependent peroxiredoxin
MKKHLVGSIVAGTLAATLLMAVPAFAALSSGTAAPDFTAEASLAGKDFTFSLKDALKKGPVVVYFYPSAYTGGCDIEAHTFATDKAKFDAAGATIIGVSADSIQRLNAFSSDPSYCAGKFPVASDADGKIAASYNLKVEAGQAGLKDVRGVAIDHGFIERTTFVIDSSGKIVATLSSEADHLHPQDHVAKSLAIVQQLKAGSAH